MNYSRTVAATIRAESVARGFATAADLAPAAGIKYSTLRRYWTGEREPKVSELAAIAGAFGLSLSQFYVLVEARMTADPQPVRPPAGDRLARDAAFEADKRRRRNNDRGDSSTQRGGVPFAG